MAMRFLASSPTRARAKARSRDLFTSDEDTPRLSAYFSHCSSVTVLARAGMWLDAGGISPSSSMASCRARRATSSALVSFCFLAAGVASAWLSTGSTTQEVAVSPFSSTPISRGTRRAVIVRPASPSFRCSTAMTTFPLVLHHADLCVDGAGERGVATRAGTVAAAVVDDDDETIEGPAQHIGGLHVGAHVHVGAFRSDQGLVKRVDADHNRLLVGALRADRRDQRLMLDDEVEPLRHQEERRVGVAGVAFVYTCLTEGLDAFLEAVRALEGAIDDRASNRAAPAPFPAKDDVHEQVKDAEALALLRRPPDDGETAPRQEIVNEIFRPGLPFDVPEAGDREAA